MRQRLATALPVLALLATAIPLAGPAAAQSSAGNRPPVATGARAGGSVVHRDEHGRAHALTARRGHVLHRAAAHESARAAATAAMPTLARTFGVSAPSRDLAPVAVSQVAGGASAVRFQQRLDGVPVFGGQLVSSLDADHNVVAVTGETAQSVTTAGFPVAPEAARASALRATAAAEHLPAASLRATTPQQWLYDASLFDAAAAAGARSVWRVEVTSTQAADVRELVLVDATTGRVAVRYNQVARELTDVDESTNKVCDNRGRDTDDYLCAAGRYVTHPATASASSDVRKAYDNARATADFYAAVAGLDLVREIGSNYGDGIKLRSTVRFCPGGCPFENAFWDGYQMVYGPGFAAGVDVVGHELTHGVTQYTSGLAYWRQSGAINESMSDVFGQLIDLSDPTDDSGTVTDQFVTGEPKRWMLGEDLSSPRRSFDPYRDMADPEAHDQPSYIGEPGEWVTGEGDNGGVHTNSGVGNKAAELIVDGGSYRGQSVTGLGGGVDTHAAVLKAGALYWAVQQKLTPGSDYFDLATALETSCAELASAGTDGFTTGDCTGTVTPAIAATSMRGGTAPDAPENVTWRGSDGEVNVYWQPASTGPKPSSYMLSAEGFGDANNYVTMDPTETEVHVFGIPVGRDLTFDLQAVSSAGTSQATSEPVRHTFKGTRLSISAPKNVTYRHRVTVSGALTLATGGAGLGGRTVRLYRKDAGRTGYRTVAATTTSADGHYAFRPTATRTATFFVRYYGASSVYLGTHSAKRGVVAHPRVALWVSDTSVRRGTTVRFSGRVMPTGSGTVTLQRRAAGHRWASVGRARLSRTGHYVFRERMGSRTDYVWRVVRWGTVTLGGAPSRSVRVRVR